MRPRAAATAAAILSLFSPPAVGARKRFIPHRKMQPENSNQLARGYLQREILDVRVKIHACFRKNNRAVGAWLKARGFII